MGVEVGLLGFGPALLAGQEVGQGEPRGETVGGVGEGCDGIPERAFGGRLTAGLHAGEAGKGGWVERAGLQGAPEQGVGFGRAALDEGDRAESVEGIGIVRVGGECLSVQGVGVGEIARRVGVVGEGDGGRAGWWRRARAEARAVGGRCERCRAWGLRPLLWCGGRS